MLCSDAVIVEFNMCLKYLLYGYIIRHVTSSARDSSGSDEHTILVTVTDGNDAPSFAGYDVDRGGFVLSVYASPGIGTSNTEIFDLSLQAVRH